MVVYAKEDVKNKEEDEEETAVLGGCHCWGFEGGRISTSVLRAELSCQGNLSFSLSFPRLLLLLLHAVT